jgi:hypothetical protein
MAPEVTRSRSVPGAVDVLEEALETLTRVGVRAWMAYLAGAAPMLAGGLLFWHVLTRPEFGEQLVVPGALALAVLYVGWNVARAVLAGEVRRQLRGAPAEPWSRGRALALARSQLMASAWRLWGVPTAALAIFPWAWAVALLRNLTVLADDAPTREWAALKRAARAEAGVWPYQAWQLLMATGFAFLLVFANVMMALLLAPTLVRMFSGQESWLTRLGPGLLATPAVWVAALGVTWLAMDPLLVAAYTVRCFHSGSQRSGEDLLARLRRLKGAAAMMALALVLGAGAARAAEAGRVEPQRVDRAIRQTLASNDYAWQTEHEGGISEDSLLGRFSRRVLNLVGDRLNDLGEAVRRFLHWLKRLLAGTPNVERNKPATAPKGLPALLVALGVLLAAGAALALAWRRRRRRAAVAMPVAVRAAAVDLADESIGADRLPEDEWLELAERMLGEGDARSALRALYLASLAWLSAAGVVALDRVKTNGEYRREVARRGRETPRLAEAFTGNVALYERVWYGRHEANPENVAEFRAGVARMKEARA